MECGQSMEDIGNAHCLIWCNQESSALPIWCSIQSINTSGSCSSEDTATEEKKGCPATWAKLPFHQIPLCAKFMSNRLLNFIWGRVEFSPPT